MSKKQKLKYLKRYTKGGLDYCYFRPSNKRIMAEFGTAAFYVEFAKAEEHWNSLKTPDEMTGTLGYLFKQYKKSIYFTELAQSTRKDYDGFMIYLEPIHNMPLEAVNAPFINELRDKTFKLKKRAVTNYMLRFLSSIFRFAKDYGMISDNPFIGIRKIKKPKDLTPVNRVWTDSEISIVFKLAPLHLKLPIALGLYTGLRKQDIIGLVKPEIHKDGWIRLNTRKTGQKVEWPIHYILKDILDEAILYDGLGYVCLSSRGNKWTSSGFNSSFGKFIKSLKDKQLVGENITFHGLRHTLAATLRESGVSNENIAIALGHSSPEMSKQYGKSANEESTMKNIISIFETHSRKNVE